MKMNPTFVTEHKAIGSVMKMINQDLWICDDRTKAKVQCKENYYE